MEECNLSVGGQHFWLPVANKTKGGMQCYSCPMCSQKVYWSAILQEWVKAAQALPSAETSGKDTVPNCGGK